jgi:hypothetical protein
MRPAAAVTALEDAPLDSINQQQPEQNRQDLQAADAIARIREVVDQNTSCFFCTASHMGNAIAARPMSVQQADERGHLWFLSASDSHKNAEMAAIHLLTSLSLPTGTSSIHCPRQSTNCKPKGTDDAQDSLEVESRRRGRGNRSDRHAGGLRR